MENEKVKDVISRLEIRLSVISEEIEIAKSDINTSVYVCLLARKSELQNSINLLEGIYEI